MKALGSSHFHFSLCKCGETVAKLGSRIQEPFSIDQRKVLNDGLSLAVSFRYKYAHSVSAVYADLPLSNSQETGESKEIIINDTDEPKSVHVRFILQKECAFGQQFILVGDDPSIGLWDPVQGVSLDWSDGHVWAVELDIPSNKVVKYKFLLIGETGAIHWQQGPDRMLETWDTEKTITVYEDWDNPDLQIIVEEETVTKHNKVGFINFENNVHKEEDLDINETEYGNCSPIDEKKEDSFPENDEMDSNVSSDLAHVLVPGLTPMDYNSFSSESATVLVPGLTPMATEEIEESLADEVQSNNDESTSSSSEEVETDNDDSTSSALEEVDDLTEPESNIGKVMSVSFQYVKANEDVIEKKQELNGNEQIIDRVFEGDMRWSRQILQKFLASFGFQIS